MSQFVETPTKSFASGAALAVNRRVKLSAGVLAYAGASDVAIGTLEAATFADTNLASGYSNGTVRLVTAQGTRKMVAVDAITAGDPVYAAASGKVSATGTVVEGRALEASTADNDVIEVLSIANTDISATVTGTNAATFTADADATTAKVAIGTGVGTGDYTAKIVAPTLAGNTTVTLPAVTATLASLAGTESLSNKTLVAPVISTGLTASGSASNNFAGSTGVFATSTGRNNLGGFVSVPTTTTPVAAAGSTVADAAQLPLTNIAHITSDGAAKGVKLQTGVKNDVVWVINDSSTAAELYAASGGTVNGLSADASVVIPASKGVWCQCTAADTWIVFDLPALATAS